MRVLVTGGAGYIGSVVAARLLALGHEVVVVDDLSTGHADAVPPGAEFHRHDVAELGDRIGAWSVDAVIHFAARSLVGQSMTDPSGYWHNNVVGTLGLLEALRSNGINRLVFSSSAACYGDTDESPITESTPTVPTSTYGATKLAIDLALGDYARAYGLSAVSLRYFNAAGAFIDGDRAYGERHLTETHLIPLALRAITSPGGAATGTLRLFGTDYPTPDGTAVRDYIHVLDLADAHVRALSLGGPGEHHVINLGCGTGYSVRQVLDTVGEVTGRPVPVIEAPRRDGDPASLVAATGRAGGLLGWRAGLDLGRIVADAWEFHTRGA